MARCTQPFTVMAFFSALLISSAASAFNQSQNSAHCLLFKAAHAELSDFTGKKIDPVTQLKQVSVHCDQKIFVVYQSIRIPTHRLRRDWVKRTEQAWTKNYCALESKFREAVRGGWTIKAEIRTVEGVEHRFIAQCFDAMAVNRALSMTSRHSAG